MTAPMSKLSSRWMDAVALVLAASAGAAVLNCIHQKQAPAAPPVIQARQAIALPQSPPTKPHYANKVIAITPCVKAALLMDETLYPSANPCLNAINVDTRSKGGTIVLTGTVQTQAMKKHAAEIAQKSSAGMSYKIDNQLVVAKR